MKDHPMLTFSVTYRLDEYLAIVRSHALAKATPNDASRLQRLKTRLLVAVVGRVMFLIKARRIGSCDFAIDQMGIARTSRQGKTLVPWSKVTALRTYETGYILEVGSGGMPVPFRVLSKSQKELLPSMVAQYSSVRDAT